MDRRGLKPNDWRVLLLGGNSGSGKTIVARKFAQVCGGSVLMVDDIRIALHQATTQNQQPDLHIFLNYKPKEWLESEKIFRDRLRVGKAMEKPLHAVISHHIVVPESGKIILEGDGILPSLTQQNTFRKSTEFAGLNLRNEVRPVFLVEDDEGAIMDNLRERGRGFNRGSQEEQRAFAHASWLFGKWLQEEAKAHNLPVLASRPQDTVVERLHEIVLDRR